MTLIAAVLTELFGLFVDDGSLAVAILAWVGVFGLARAGFGLDGQWSGVLLFAGLVAILFENVLRRARR